MGASGLCPQNETSTPPDFGDLELRALWVYGIWGSKDFVDVGLRGLGFRGFGDLRILRFRV